MCNMIYTEKLSERTVEEARQTMRINPHGFGARNLSRGTTFQTLKSKAMLKKLESWVGDSVVFHARLATSGLKTVGETHPFTVGSFLEHRGHLFHNGVLPELGDEERVDTNTLAQMLAVIPCDSGHDWLDRASLFLSRLPGKYIITDTFIGVRCVNFKPEHWSSGHSEIFFKKCPVCKYLMLSSRSICPDCREMV